MRFLASVVFLILISSCSKKVSYDPIEAGDIVRLELRDKKQNSCCREIENYIPDEDMVDEMPVYKIKTVFHYMYSSKGEYNLPRKEAIKYAHDLINECNAILKKRVPLNIPYGNNLPALPKLYEYVITPLTDDPNDLGIYFHNDPSDNLYFMVSYGKNKNNYNRDLIKTFAERQDSFMNIFMQPHHPDSVISKTYKPRRVGIALGTSLKVAGYYANKRAPEEVRGLTNHEIGHILGLSHTWNGRDGCDDTPKNKNCWIIDKNNPPCDTGASNNMMDYNAYQTALSPCQLGKIHMKLANTRSRSRKLVDPHWCEMTEPVIIDNHTEWRGNKDISGDLIIKSGQTLKVLCRLSLPKNARIIIEPDAELILNNCLVHNSCGENWGGIIIGKKGKKKGKLTLEGKVEIEQMNGELPSVE